MGCTAHLRVQLGLGLPTLDLGIPGLPPLLPLPSPISHPLPPYPSFLSLSPPSFPFPGGPTPKPARGYGGARCKLPQWGLWWISEPKGAALVATVFVHFHKNKFKFLYKHKSRRVWLTKTIQNTIHSLVNSHISMPGGQFSHFRDKMSLARDTGHCGSIPGRSRPFLDGWQP